MLNLSFTVALEMSLEVQHTRQYLRHLLTRRRRRIFICQKGWLPERASAHQRWLPYTQQK